MIRIGSTADSHLDEKAQACGRIIVGPDGRSIRAADRERCLSAAVTGMIERDVDLIVQAGDLWDHARPTPAEYVIASRELDRAANHAPVVAVACNHGMSQSPLEQHALAPLIGRHPNLHIFIRPDVTVIQTKSGPVQVAALPWPQRSTLAAKEELSGLSPEGLNALIGDKLTAIIRYMLSSRKPGMPLILVGHIMLREAIFGSGQGPDTGAITISAQDLEGFNAAILGDIHNAQSFGTEGRIFYCGSTDRCDFGEESNSPGWWMVNLDGGQFSKEQIETPARRYLTLTPTQLAMTPPESLDLERPPILRVKGRVSQEEYDALQPVLARWRAIPTFAEALEITRQTTARSEAMRADLTEEGALRLWHATNGRPEDLDELLAEHRVLAGVTQ